ncbi:hypothetical protein B0H12DRAFT_1103714 [Mycena haematopus]|nr:hypothetical protein B0H12DRAFT_1103714 [Mycena haematopus]
MSLYFTESNSRGYKYPSPTLQPSPPPPPPIKDEHIRFVLLRDLPAFYLEIPKERVEANCKRPVKYLKYLAFIIVGLSGEISTRLPSEATPGSQQDSYLSDEERLIDRVCYYFVHEDATLAAARDHIVDASFVHATTASQTNLATQKLRQDFFQDCLILRDGALCTFTGLDMCQAHHIVPVSKGDEGLKKIRDKRLGDDQKDSDVIDINDPRNGITLCEDLHKQIVKYLAILPTPNRILTMNDMHARAPRKQDLDPGFHYPTDRRYTLQWIAHPGKAEKTFQYQGTDAVFVANWVATETNPTCESPPQLRPPHETTDNEDSDDPGSSYNGSPDTSGSTYRPVHQNDASGSGRILRSHQAPADDPADDDDDAGDDSDDARMSSDEHCILAIPHPYGHGPYNLPSEYLLNFCYASTVLRNWSCGGEYVRKLSEVKGKKCVAKKVEQVKNGLMGNLGKIVKVLGKYRPGGTKKTPKGFGSANKSSSKKRQMVIQKPKPQLLNEFDAGDLVLQLSLVNPKVREQQKELTTLSVSRWQSDTAHQLDLDLDACEVDSASGSGHGEAVTMMNMDFGL